ncbi:hypothetical protein D9M68_747490 [compost metagenome]
MRDLVYPVPFPQAPGQVQGEVGRHLGIGQGAVGLAGIGQARPGIEGAELVVGRLGQQAPRQQQGTGEGLAAGAADARQLEVPELLVEGGVVRQQRQVADEIGRLLHHLCHRWRIPQHGGADAGEVLDEGRYRDAGVHQALVAVDDAPAVEDDHADLGGAAVVARRDAGGLEVDYGYGVHG